MEPPRFLKPVNGLDVPEGGQAVFEVVVSGQPLPEVTWFHEGRQIQHGPDFQVNVIALHRKPLSELRSVTCHMASHVFCHPTLP